MAVALSVLSAIAPAGAGAFVGESAVLNPAKTDLTGPAKTILTKPTFLPANVGEAGLGKGVVEAGRAAGVFSSAGILPALGSVLSFGVGTVIGSEICGVLGIEGCWYFGSEGADPVPAVSGSWQWRGSPLWAWEWSGGFKPWDGVLDTHVECGATPPVGWTHTGSEGSSQPCNHLGEIVGTYTPSTLLRSAMANRVIEHHPTDDPSISNYSHSAPSKWSENLAAQLKNAPDDSAAGKVGQKIASEIEGSGVASPYGVVTVPNCSGEAWIGCEELLEDFELVPERDTLTWEEADLDLDADAVVQTQPVPGSKVTTGTKVVVTTNPDEAGMPAVVPAPLPNETYDDYIARLAPSLDPNRVTVSPEFTDPSTGPDGVIRTVPKSGTRTNPQTETELDVQTNPPDAPPAAAPWTAPPIPAIDLGPLAGVSIGCNDFPFGIFCWIGAGLTSWGPGGECPTIGVPMGSSVGISDELAFDLCQFEPAMEIVRPVLILLSAFCLAYLFAAAAMGFGGSTGSEN